MKERLPKETAPKFECLNDSDTGWLGVFGVLPPGEPERGSFMQALDRLGAQGSLDLRGSYSPNGKRAVVVARHTFFEMLNLDNAVQRLAANNRPIPLPSTFIRQQRMLHRYRLNGAKAVNRYLNILSHSTERIESQIRLLEELGIDVVKVVNRHPSILSLSAERIKSHLRLLEELGIDTVKVVNRYPNILGSSTGRIESQIRLLEELGIDAVKVVNRHPGILSSSTGRIESQIRLLEELGIDAVKAANRFPDILCLSAEKIESQMRLLTERGISAVKAANRFPNILMLSAERVKSHLRLLEELGLDAVKVVNHRPVVLGLGAERIKSHLRLLEELGIDAVKVVNHHPNILNLSEENIRAKIVFLQKTVNLLKWDYNLPELVNIAPSIIGFNLKKLVILRRLLAEHVHLEARAATPEYIRSGAIIPLEAYMLALADLPENGQLTLAELRSKAKKVQRKHSAPERKQRTKDLSENAGTALGRRICELYLDYV